MASPSQTKHEEEIQKRISRELNHGQELSTLYMSQHFTLMLPTLYGIWPSKPFDSGVLIRRLSA